MNINAIQEFVVSLQNHFTPPKHTNVEQQTAWLRAIVEALRGSSPTVLALAKRRMIESRKNRYFPLIAEIREACREAAREIEFDVQTQTLPNVRAATGDEWSTERLKLAYDLIRSAMGKDAAQNGWIGPLWAFCRKNQRLPAGREIEACKREAKEFDAAYARCVTGAAGPMSGVLMQLGDSMLAKRLKLEAEVMGRAV